VVAAQAHSLQSSSADVVDIDEDDIAERPLDWVLASTSSWLAPVIPARRERGDIPVDPVRVANRGGRLFAEIQFQGKPHLWFVMELDQIGLTAV